MCRLFGFRSAVTTRVNRLLVDAENALSEQSSEHPDGWGLAYYAEGVPHLTRCPETACEHLLFRDLSAAMVSKTVVAHVRRATRGSRSVLNCHPFQYGRWIFAHNGDIPNLDEVRDRLMAQIAPSLRAYVLGQTDSELVFYIFLSQLWASGSLRERRAMSEIIASARSTVLTVRRICDDGALSAALTFVVTDGDVLVAVQSGKPLVYSIQRERSDRYASREDSSPRRDARLATHFIVSSERIAATSNWEELAYGQILGIDGGMRLARTTIEAAQAQATTLASALMEG